MTRKHTTKKQQFWPGTNTVKSENNAFDWKSTAKGLFNASELAALQSGIKAKLNTEFKPGRVKVSFPASGGTPADDMIIFLLFLVRSDGITVV